MTDSALGMATTCGAYALENTKAGNAPIIDKILRAGMIIIGKANLSELGGSKGFGIRTGWSALGGQTQSPYVRGGFAPDDKMLGHSAPAGSSSGSAVSVAAGFSPISLGTESDGSITQPAGRASLYALKVTVGALSTRRTSPQSPITDSVGGFAKSAADVALLTGVMMDQDYTPFLSKSWRGQRVAWVDPAVWKLDTGVCEPVESVRQKQKRRAADRCPKSFPEFPGQEQLEECLISQTSDEKRHQILCSIRATAKDNGFDKIFAETKSEVLMGPLDSRVVTIAAAAGYPCGVVPLGYADNYNGRAYGVAIVARAGEEGKIFRAMSAWEATMPARKAPPLLRSAERGI
ncbi:Glutamyl-tRNA(Gln) amidotransferase subunit A [Hyphodiscus hymeniophilus]|uniref:Glutamyl-tRNA(Gln) amidotransferase subunit A n=1 Tax=Hyphodiscus hymeniophilus TaxID=353542 RepID=A0A9P6VGM5_9HELO|nr:Glutamyl-tRNA(Gln) amidotransferase subunit A [Hyphodiscus hymeniophilus]